MKQEKRKILLEFASSIVIMVDVKTFFESSTARESRLIFRHDMTQLWRDTNERHIQAIRHPIKDPVGAIGAPVMAVGAGVAKIGNAVAGLFSSEEAKPLPDGGLAYLRRDIGSVGTNAAAAIKNILTLHPLRAAGNVIKGTFDALDVVTVDPLLDVGSGIFGHQHNVRNSVQHTLAA